MSALSSISDIQDFQAPTITDYSRGWKTIPVEKIADTKLRQLAFRLNGLGSLHYFGKVILRRHRLNNTLHKTMCNQIERSRIKDVIEIPRDHFKSTIYSEIAPIWWALPFTPADEQSMRALGYDDEWVRWMRKAHNQDTRTLLVSSIIDNAIKLGTRIAHHYENNDFFRSLYPEITPDSSCIWNAKTLHHKRSKHSPNGEGTYDFLGAGGALQSRHYDRVVQDDLVGKDAIESPDVMEGIIDYHRLLPGAFDSVQGDPTATNDELVVGNRWSCTDLNYWIRKNEPFFRVTTHAVMGGCCDVHPRGTPIFPEEFSEEKCREFKIRFGVYFYSCQFENNPVPEGETEFDTKWLRFYNLDRVNDGDRAFSVAQHEVQDGEALLDVPIQDMKISMVVDPNHSGDKGRCRHAITVTGAYKNRIYLLYVWAKACGYNQFIEEIYSTAKKFRLAEFWLETVAAQKYLKEYLEYKNEVTGTSLRVNELKVDHSANAKLNRIRALNVYFADGRFWCHRVAHQDFVEEYSKFPYGETVDILDTLGYAPQTWDSRRNTSEVMDFMRQHKNSFGSRASNSLTGY